MLSLKGERLTVRGSASPEEALAAAARSMSGRWSASIGALDPAILGRVTSSSITAYAKRRNVSSVGTQVFAGRISGDGSGCVADGSMRSFAFARVITSLVFALAIFGAVDGWVLLIVHALEGDLSRSMVGAGLVTTALPVAFFYLYAWAVAYSASDTTYLKAWLSDCLGDEESNGRTNQPGPS